MHAHDHDVGARPRSFGARILRVGARFTRSFQRRCPSGARWRRKRGSPNEIRAALPSAAALPLFPVAFVVWHGNRACCCIEQQQVCEIDNQVEPAQLDLHFFHNVGSSGATCHLFLDSRVEPVPPKVLPENLVEPARLVKFSLQKSEFSRLETVEKHRNALLHTTQTHTKHPICAQIGWIQRIFRVEPALLWLWTLSGQSRLNSKKSRKIVF